MNWLVLLIMATISIVHLKMVFSDEPHQQKDGELQQYLTELGLDDLKITLVQRQFNGTTNPRDKELYGKRLLDFYNSRLYSSDMSPEQMSATLASIKKLIETVPQIATPETNVMILQGEYEQGVLEFMKWFEDQANAELRKSAKEKMLTVILSLDQQRGALIEKIKTFDTQIDAERSETEVERLVKEQLVYKTAELRSLYCQGWGRYYLALLETDKDTRVATIKAGRQAIIDLLSFVPDEDYKEGTSASLGLESPVRARGVLALALFEFLSSETEHFEKCLEWLEGTIVPPEVINERDRAVIVCMLSDADKGAAINQARKAVEAMTIPASLSQVQYCTLLLKYGLGNKSAAGAKEIVELGVQGLVRQRQFQLIADILKDEESKAPDPSNFFLAWYRGYETLKSAEESGKKEDFATAAISFQAALALPGADADKSLQNYCKYQLGWSKYKAEQFEEAAEIFGKSSAELKDIDEETAVTSLWLKAVCYQQLSKADSKFVVQAIGAFDQLAQQFPQHPKASEAKYQVGRLQRFAGSSTNTRNSLESIKPDDPNYPMARYEIVVARHQQWNQVKSDPAQVDKVAQQLFSDVDLFMSLRVDKEFEPKRLKAVLFAADCALKTPGMTKEVAKDFLKQASSLAARMPAADASVATYHYYEYLVAKAEKDSAVQKREAIWLVENSREKTHQQAALVFLVADTEAKLKATMGGESSTIRSDLSGYLDKLVKNYGTDVVDIAGNHNARVAAFKLGVLQFESKKYDEALPIFTSLVATFPDDQKYLRYLGLCQIETSMQAEAQETWSKLVRGTKSGSEPWFEAKYYQLRTIAQKDREEAKKGLKQVRLLFPEIPVEAWRDRFAQLDKQIGG